MSSVQNLRTFFNNVRFMLNNINSRPFGELQFLVTKEVASNANDVLNRIHLEGVFGRAEYMFFSEDARKVLVKIRQIPDRLAIDAKHVKIATYLIVLSLIINTFLENVNTAEGPGTVELQNTFRVFQKMGLPEVSYPNYSAH